MITLNVIVSNTTTVKVITEGEEVSIVLYERSFTAIA